MRYGTRSILTGGMLVAALLVAPLALAQAPDADDSARESVNVQIHFRMGTLDGDERTTVKSYTLVVASGSMGSTLLSGKRVPFPLAADGSDDDADDKDTVRKVVYQNIGFATNARAWVVDGNKIKLMADIEDSRIRETDDEELPVVETIQLTINTILTDGVPIEVTRATGVTDKPGFVEVEARILR